MKIVKKKLDRAEKTKKKSTDLKATIQAKRKAH